MPRIAGNQRNPDREFGTDLYPTPEHWTEALLRRVRLTGPVWDPACGTGGVTDVLRAAGYRVRATDITGGVDFLEQRESWPGSIVCNPPFRLGDEFTQHALELAAGQVAILRQVGALGGQKRRATLWSARPPSRVIVISRRMKVYGKPSQFCHLWTVFEPGGNGTMSLEWEA
jgi:hypothetical protein